MRSRSSSVGMSMRAALVAFALALSVSACGDQPIAPSDVSGLPSGGVAFTTVPSAAPSPGKSTKLPTGKATGKATPKTTVVPVDPSPTGVPIGNLSIPPQKGYCSFRPRSYQLGGDILVIAVHVDWVGLNSPTQLVTMTAGTFSGSTASVSFHITMNKYGQEALYFSPRTSDLGTTLHITLTLDPKNLINETNELDNLAHVVMTVPKIRPTKEIKQRCDVGP